MKLLLYCMHMCVHGPHTGTHVLHDMEDMKLFINTRRPDYMIVLRSDAVITSEAVTRDCAQLHRSREVQKSRSTPTYFIGMFYKNQTLRIIQIY